MIYTECMASFLAALTINSIKKFFEAVISEAKAILEWYVYGASQRTSVGQCGPVPNLPSLTVSPAHYSGSIRILFSHQIFLDEVNTASCPGFIKEIITDRTMDGKVQFSIQRIELSLSYRKSQRTSLLLQHAILIVLTA